MDMGKMLKYARFKPFLSALVFACSSTGDGSNAPLKMINGFDTVTNEAIITTLGVPKTDPGLVVAAPLSTIVYMALVNQATVSADASILSCLVVRYDDLSTPCPATCGQVARRVAFGRIRELALSASSGRSGTAALRRHIFAIFQSDARSRTLARNSRIAHLGCLAS